MSLPHLREKLPEVTTSTAPLAAIDVGTNSLHMVVARPTEGGAPEVLAREKTPVRLGSGAADMKHLDPEAVDRTIKALGDFRRIADAHDANVVAIATSAVREAEDKTDLRWRCSVPRRRQQNGTPLSLLCVCASISVSSSSFPRCRRAGGTAGNGLSRP